MTKLWVFDTQNHIEIYAETQEEAEKQVNEITNVSGISFFLHERWEEYQEDWCQACEDGTCSELTEEKEGARL